jgi:hypothetical protein
MGDGTPPCGSIQSLTLTSPRVLRLATIITLVRLPAFLQTGMARQVRATAQGNQHADSSSNASRLRSRGAGTSSLAFPQSLQENTGTATASFQSLSSSLFANNPTNRRYMVWVTYIAEGDVEGVVQWHYFPRLQPEQRVSSNRRWECWYGLAMSKA